MSFPPKIAIISKKLDASQHTFVIFIRLRMSTRQRSPPGLALVGKPVKDAWDALTNAERMTAFRLGQIIGATYPDVEKGVNHCEPRVMMSVSLEPDCTTESEREVEAFREMTPEARGFVIEFGMWSMYVCPDLKERHATVPMRNNVVAFLAVTEQLRGMKREFVSPFTHAMDFEDSPVFAMKDRALCELMEDMSGMAVTILHDSLNLHMSSP